MTSTGGFQKIISFLCTSRNQLYIFINNILTYSNSHETWKFFWVPFYNEMNDHRLKRLSCGYFGIYWNFEAKFQDQVVLNKIFNLSFRNTPHTYSKSRSCVHSRKGIEVRRWRERKRSFPLIRQFTGPNDFPHFYLKTEKIEVLSCRWPHFMYSVSETRYLGSVM